MPFIVTQQTMLHTGLGDSWISHPSGVDGMYKNAHRGSQALASETTAMTEGLENRKFIYLHELFSDI